MPPVSQKHSMFNFKNFYFPITSSMSFVNFLNDCISPYFCTIIYSDIINRKDHLIEDIYL